MRKKIKVRYDRIFAVLIITVLPIILLLFLSDRNLFNARKEISTESKYEDNHTTTTPFTASITTESVIITTQPKMISRIEYPDCRAAAVFSIDDEEYLYNDNIHVRTAPASLTKLLTASVALEYADPDDVFTVGSEQWLVQPYSSLCYLQIGNVITLKDLITGMLMASGNDAAYTIAVSVAREQKPEANMTDDEAVAYFCGMMNDFARKIKMNNSSFVNPDGWDDEGQYTTVSDLINLTKYALSVPEISKITGTFQKSVTIVSGEVFEWTNSNLMLSPYSEFYQEKVIGVKTGTTPEAGNCLISAFNEKEKTYITIVVGCDSDYDRYDLTEKLISSVY